MPVIQFNLTRSLNKMLNTNPLTPSQMQKRVLKKLLRKARFTSFGQDYGFDEILLAKNFQEAFSNRVPVYDYNSLFSDYWHKTLEGAPDITWPGKTSYFALSSGTSEAASKYIPVTRDLIRANTLTSMRMLLSLSGYNDLKFNALPRGWLILGGSTDLQKGPTYFAGDLSGIQQKNIPFWFQAMYKPGKKIARLRDWEDKLEEIATRAPEWDIGFMLGVPAWLQLCLEKIIEKHNLNHIHELWPNLSYYVHGGVALEPYKKNFNRLLGHPITYIETYLASEGFLAFQNRQNASGMRLAFANNIYFEFIPFNTSNFDDQGNLLPGVNAIPLENAEADKEYAVLITTNGGAWRYLIGDTIKFTDLKRCEIHITGRTKHFLSLVGEHLSVDNMHAAIRQVSEKFDLSIPEFTVAGIPYKGSFAHHWYLACDAPGVEADQLLRTIDENLKSINDDYSTERHHALSHVFLTVLPEKTFMDFMAARKKIGGQHKFPRVLKGRYLEDWQAFISSQK